MAERAEDGTADRRVGGAARRHEVRRPGRSARALLSQPEQFVTAVTEKLLTYALGRGLEYYDAPAIRKIVREARRRQLPHPVARSSAS